MFSLPCSSPLHSPSFHPGKLWCHRRALLDQIQHLLHRFCLESERRREEKERKGKDKIERSQLVSMQLASPREGRSRPAGHAWRWKHHIKNSAQLAQHEHQPIRTDPSCQWSTVNNVALLLCPAKWESLIVCSGQQENREFANQREICKSGDLSLG